MTFALALALAATTAVAGPYDQPWSLVERGDNSETRKESQVAITKIDGVSMRDPRNPEPVAPGKHTVTINFTSAAGKFHPETVDLPMDLKPCTRYRVVAQYKTRTGGEWKPKVYSETIGECRKKFAPKTPK
jgi:hypothetical protein